MSNFYKSDPRYPADRPHYVITTASDWREQFPTRSAAVSWIEGYRVSQAYKEEHYSVISYDEFWDRRNGNRPLRFA